MISWIQKYFQHHFRLVFMVILLAMAVPLVVIYSQSSGLGQRGYKHLDQPFFNYNLSQQEDVRRMMSDAELSSMLRGQMLYNQNQLVQAAYFRVAGLAVADELHLPQPNDSELSAFIARLPAFANQNGQFDQATYTRFQDSLRTSGRFTIGDASRVMRDDARLEKLQQVVGGPGHVSAKDVATVLSRLDSVWTVQVATIDYAKFDAGVTATDEAVQKFFEENSFRYEVPPRAKLSAIEFKASEFPVSVTPTEEQLRGYFEANRSRFPAPPKADGQKPAVSVDGKTPAAEDYFPAVRSQVEAALKLEASLVAASRTANDFAVALFESKTKANSPELAAFIGSQRRTAVALPPFSPDNPPAAMPWMAQHFEQVAQLNQQKFFSDPVRSPEGFLVLLWNETLPSYKPVLAEVKDKVIADYKEAEKRKRFVDRGRSVQAQLQAAVQAGAAFDKAAADARVEAKAYAGFTLQQPPQDFPRMLLSTLMGLEAGKVSDMVAASEQGYLVYAQERKQPDLTPSNPRYAEIRGRLMMESSATNTVAYLSDRVQAELKKSQPAAAASATP